MQRFPRYCLLATAVLAMSVLAVSVEQRPGNRASKPLSLEDWDIPTWADHLNRAGLKVQLHSTSKNGSIGLNAFLTTTHKDWEELSHLSIDPGPSRIQEWRGIVYCARAGKGVDLHIWPDHSLAVGPFYFYGDVELLKRIGAILLPSDPPAAL